MIETKKNTQIYGKISEKEVPAFLCSLRSERYLRGISQAKIAKKMNTTPSAIARLENGGGKLNHSPSLKTLVNYAQAIGFDLIVTISKSKKL